MTTRIAVSLLPAEYIQKRRRQKTLHKVRTGMVCGLAVLLAVLAASAGVYFAKAGQVRAVEEQNQLALQQISTLSEYEAIAQAIQELGQQVQSIERVDPQWLSYLLTTARALPDGVWLESYQGSSQPVEGAAPVVTCTTRCSGATYGDIARTMEALEATVVCTSSSVNDGGVSFELTLTLLPTSSVQG